MKEEGRSEEGRRKKKEEGRRREFGVQFSVKVCQGSVITRVSSHVMSCDTEFVLVQREIKERLHCDYTLT